MTITKIDLTTLSLAQLATVYNTLTETDHQIKKFADRAAATKRVERKLTEGTWVVMAEDVNIANGVKVPLGFGFLVQQCDFDALVAAAPAPVVKAKKSRAIFGEDELIQAAKSENPKRKGSKAAARFGLLLAAPKHTMTVGQYLDACVALEGDEAEDRFKYRRDVAWDIEHGFIVFPRGASEA